MKNNYKSLSKDEVYFISRAEFEKQTLINTAFVQNIFKDKNKASKVIFSLKRKGRLLVIEKGKYLLVPIKAPNQKWMPNDFLIASLWMGTDSYYVGYNTAYNYWGLTEQVPQAVYILNTKKASKKIINKVAYIAIKVSFKKIYGLQKVIFDDGIAFISDRERTLIDFIDNPIGGWSNVENVVSEQLNKINIKRFIKYLISYPIASIRKRAGYLLEKLGFNKDLLVPLKNSIKDNDSYIVFNPFIKSRKGIINKTWKVILNE